MILHDIIDCKWVYKMKWKADGFIDGYKARFVVKDFKQRYGTYYEDTFGPVVKVVYCQGFASYCSS